MADENYWQSNDVPVVGQQPAAGEQISRGHSGLGIASFVISIVAGLIIFVSVVMAAVLTARAGGQLNEESPEAIIVGCSMFAGVLFYLVGIGLAIGGLCQPNRYKVFPVLGLVLNVVFLLGIAALMVIGLLAA